MHALKEALSRVGCHVVDGFDLLGLLGDRYLRSYVCRISRWKQLGPTEREIGAVCHSLSNYLCVAGKPRERDAPYGKGNINSTRKYTGGCWHSLGFLRGYTTFKITGSGVIALFPW